MELNAIYRRSFADTRTCFETHCVDPASRVIYCRVGHSEGGRDEVPWCSEIPLRVTETPMT